MSRNRDTRIVEMQFDNVRFEQNASRTLSTLDKLKQAMKFEGITDGFKKIEKASGTLTFKTLSDGVQTVSNKFSALNAVAFSVLNNITNQAVNAGRNLVNSLTLEPVTTGFQEYEIKMGSVQVLAANLGALTEDTANNLKLTASEMQAVEDAINGVYGSGANRIKALAEAGYDYERIQQGINKETSKNSSTNKENKASMEEINETLERMNTFADKTIYNYAQMTSNLGKFVAAGVDLDRSEKAITGLAALAAMSGATAQDMSRASYQMSQAMGTGFIKLMDWNSLVNANMGTKGFQDQIMDVARSHGVAVDEIIKANGSFRDSLSEGWLTTDIFLETLQRYTDESTELGQTAMKAATEVKSVSMLLDTLKESVQSGWTQSWELIIGDYFEAKTILTQINDEINAILKPMEDWRNLQLQVWHDASNGRDEFIEDMSKFFKFIGKVLEPIKDAFVEVFDLDNGDAVLIKLTSRFTQFVNKLEITDETADKLKRTFKGVFSIFKIVGNSIRAVLNVIGKQIGGIDFANSGAFSTMADWGDQLEELSNTTFSVENIEKSLYDLGDAIKEFISTLSEQIQNNSIVKFIKNLFGSKEETDELNGTIDTVSDGVDKTESAFGKLRSIKKVFSSSDGDDSEDGSIVSWLENFAKSILEALKEVDIIQMVQIVGAVSAVVNLLHTIFSSTKKVEKAADTVKKFPETIKGFFENLGNAIKAKSRYESMAALAAAIGITATSIYLLGNMDTGKLLQGVAVITGVGIALMVMNAITTKVGKMPEGTKFEKVYYSYVAFASAIGILVLSLWGLTKIIESTSAENIAISLLVLTDIMSSLVLVSAAISKLVTGGDNVVKASAGLLLFSIGIAAIVTSLIGLELAMKNANPNAIWGLVSLITSLIGSITGLVAVVGALKPEKMGMLGFGLAEMATGLSVMINALTMLELAMSKASANAIWGMVTLVTSLFGSLTGFVAVVGALKPEKLGMIGFGIAEMAGGLSVMIDSLALLQLSMKGSNANAIWGMVALVATTIGALTGLVAVIGATKPEKMMSVGAGIAIMFMGVSSIFKATAKIKGMNVKQIAAAAGIISVVGGVVVAIVALLKNIDKSKFKAIKGVVTSIGLVITALMGMIYLLSKVPTDNLEQAQKAFDSVAKTMIILVGVAAAFGVVIAVIDKFASKSTSVVRASSNMGNRKNYTGIIRFGVALQTVTMAMLEFGGGVYLFNEGIKTMLENIETLAGTDVSTITKGFSNALTGFTADENREKLSSFIFDSLSDGVKRIPELTEDIIDSIANTLTVIAGGIGRIGEAALGVAEAAINFVSTNAERLGNDIRELLVSIFKIIETIFSGTSDDMTSGTKNSLADSILGAITAAIDAVGISLKNNAETIAKSAGSLAEGIWAVLSFSVAGLIKTLGSEDYQFYWPDLFFTGLGGMSEENWQNFSKRWDIDNMASADIWRANWEYAVGKTESFFRGLDIAGNGSNLLENYMALGQVWDNFFSLSSKGITFEALEHQSKIFKNLFEEDPLYKGLIPGEDASAILFKSWKQTMITGAKYLWNWISGKAIRDFIARFVKSYISSQIAEFKEKIATYAEKFKKLGTDIIGLIIAGFKVLLYNPIGIIYDGIRGELGENNPVTDWTTKFQAIGEDIVSLIAEGFKNFDIVSAAENLAGEIWDAFNGDKGTDSHSPSKKFELAGGYIAAGVAEGIKKGAQKPAREAVDMAEKCKNAFNQNIKKSMNLSEIVEDTVSDPVIRPRVDLSDVNAGANAVNSMFGNYSVGLASRTANSIDTNMMEKARQAYTKSSNNKTLVDSVNGLREDMRYYADAQSKTNIVLDTGVLVGSTASKMDRQLGIRAARAKRGN